MKKILVFAGDIYYPLGGMKDFKGSFETEDEVMKFLLQNHFEWCNCIDTETGEKYSINI